jgi:hypothetical protein
MKSTTMDPIQSHNTYISRLKTLYPLQEPDRTHMRKQDQPMQVLALGLSRTGTDSLRQALLILGYHECYHGIFQIIHRMCDVPQFIRLLHARSIGRQDVITSEAFEKVLGDCTAVSDEPCCLLGPEMIRSYPEAKVILNRRIGGGKAWVEGAKKTIVPQLGAARSFLRFFQTDAFWTGKLMDIVRPVMLQPVVDGKGEEYYNEHYDELVKVCKEEGREYLDWTAEEGWEPICRLL